MAAVLWVVGVVFWLLVLGLFPSSALWDDYSSEFLLQTEYAALYFETGGLIEGLEGDLVGWGVSRVVHAVKYILLLLY